MPRVFWHLVARDSMDHTDITETTCLVGSGGAARPPAYVTSLGYVNMWVRVHDAHGD